MALSAPSIESCAVSEWYPSGIGLTAMTVPPWLGAPGVAQDGGDVNARGRAGGTWHMMSTSHRHGQAFSRPHLPADGPQSPAPPARSPCPPRDGRALDVRAPRPQPSQS